MFIVISIIEKKIFYLMHFVIMNIHNLNYLLTWCDAYIRNKIKFDIFWNYFSYMRMDSNVKYAINWEILLQIIYDLTNVNINNQIWMHFFPYIKIINRNTTKWNISSMVDSLQYNTIEFNPYDLALENVKPKTINNFNSLHLDPTNEI